MRNIPVWQKCREEHTGMILHISLSYNLIFKAVYTCQLISIYDSVCDDDPYIDNEILKKLRQSMKPGAEQFINCRNKKNPPLHI